MSNDTVLTQEQIDHLWDTRVGEPSSKYPLDTADKLNFARAIEQAVLQSVQVQRLRNRVAIPDGIRLMAERIAADTFEHCTADPIFTVERRRIVTGLDLDYCEDVGWFCDGDQITGDEATALEAAYEETSEIPDDHTRTGIMEAWEHFATYVTMEAAQEFVEKKGDQYRVYVDSGCRNHEWKALRAFLLSVSGAAMEKRP